MERQHHPGFCSFFHPLSPDQVGGSSDQTMMNLSITSTTGCPVELTVPSGETTESLKARISIKLKLQANRIILLHRNRSLVTGKLVDQGVTDGSKLTLVPVIETGLPCSTTRERTMRNVLESLTQVQLNDFLSGRLPLTLSIGIGAHMMYVQLQLSPQQNVKEVHQNKNPRLFRGSELQTGSMTHSTLEQPNSTWSTGSTTSQTSFLPKCSSNSTSLNECHIQKAGSTRHSPSCAPHFASHNPGFAGLASTPFSPSGLPHCSSPMQANIPICSDRTSGSKLKAPSAAAASVCSKCDITAKQPGANIESFVSHSPGVFSGTFSGTLAPSSQNNVGNNGITIVLQILQDLLIAAHHHHQEASPPYHCSSVSNQNPSQVTEEKQCKATSRTRPTSVVEQCANEETQVLHSSTEENKTLHYKLKRLQHLMHQKRLRKRTYKSSQLYQKARPNRHPYNYS